MSESNVAPQVPVRLQAGCSPIRRRSFEPHGPPCRHRIYHGAQCGHTLLAARRLSDQPCVGGVWRCRLLSELRACNLSAAGGRVTRKAGDRCGTVWNIEVCPVFDHMVPQGMLQHEIPSQRQFLQTTRQWGTRAMTCHQCRQRSAKRTQVGIQVLL